MKAITYRSISLGFLSGLIVIAVGGCGQKTSAPDPSVVAPASTYKPAPGPNPGLAVMQQYKAVEGMTPEQRANYYKSHPGSDGPGPMPRRRDE
jgi:hypothetical protein